MPAPRFSVLLPTKNRSIIVGDAIRSVLEQTLHDWELVVSDNDDSNSATREVVAGFHDPRIRYFRTSGTLAMHENWESAFQNSTGSHVLVLEDKQRLNRNALETLDRVLASHPDAVITYPVVLTREDVPPPLPRDLNPVLMSAAGLLDRYCDFDEESWQYLPRGLNSVAPATLLRDLQRTSPTGRVFSHLTPDHSQAYQVLSRVEGVLHLPGSVIYIPLSLGKKGSFSNGLSCMRKDANAQRWFDQLPVSIEDLVRDVPIQTHWMPVNIVLYDFQRFLRRSGYTPRYNWVRYHSLALYMVLLGRWLGCDMTPELSATAASLRKRPLGFGIRVGLDLVRRLVLAVIRKLQGDRRL